MDSTSTTGPNGNNTTSYGYDAAGNTTTRTTPAQGQQRLTWSDDGLLTAVTNSSGGSSYIYDADGNLLLQKDPGTTTLYLPNEQIVLNTTSGVITGTRFYALPGGGEAVRTGSGTNFSFELGDPHGTATLTLNNTLNTPTWRQQTPYGDPRGTPPSVWPDNHGFLNQPQDTTTGLTHIGARWYDPTLGRFTSLDPAFEPTSPQEQNGYTYAASNPITRSDPTGLRSDECMTGGHASACDRSYGHASHSDYYGDDGSDSRSSGCSWRCWTKSIGGGFLDGITKVSIVVTIKPFVAITRAAATVPCAFLMQNRAGCEMEAGSGADTIDNSLDKIDNISGADPHEHGYRVGRILGEYGAPLLIPGVGEEADAGEAGSLLPRLLRQGVGAGRNKANDTYLGRLLMKRPMEPWRSNRLLYRQLDGRSPEPNATVKDLLELMPGNPSISYKAANAGGRSDLDLIRSVFNPRDGQYIATYAGRPGVISQGNHRAMELIARAEDPNNDYINWGTRIFINRVGE